MFRQFNMNSMFSPFYKNTQTTLLSLSYLYSGAVFFASLYGIKKGTETWLNWKQTRVYRKISIDYVESVINIACDGGKWAYYALLCATSNAFIAATCPISVPILLYFFEQPKIESDNTDNVNNKIEIIEASEIVKVDDPPNCSNQTNLEQIDDSSLLNSYYKN